MGTPWQTLIVCVREAAVLFWDRREFWRWPTALEANVARTSKQATNDFMSQPP